ncbi:MAG: DEAD/DEAH box helicase family protein [Victivallales bacterium]|nr:DEAD/DEAH box helicase family protein [Victivallales bacterium]
MEERKVITVDFVQGTLLLNGPADHILAIREWLKYDERVGMFRARALHYGPIMLKLHRLKIPFADRARQFQPLQLQLHGRVFSPLPHQDAALAAWKHGGSRGVVVLPTGSGKSYLAVLAMREVQRPTLIIVPTIDLMQQWARQLETFFQVPVGMLGGGSRDIRDLTVSTYDSAVLQMEFIGNCFGFLVFDECHHLPGPTTQLAATMAMAPFRLGLTATPERNDDGEQRLYELIGPLAYRIDIDELEGKVLAPYVTRKIELDLDPDEAEEYRRARQLYRDFLQRHGIAFRSSNDWQRFIGQCARHPDGRAAFQAYLRQKSIARGGRSKLRRLWELLGEHRGERIIVFTAENDIAYRIGQLFLLPVLTHKTKAAERKEMLEKFCSGAYPVLVTSNVLNEGVDVPEAGVGIIVSGSGSVREHVQRLGRILRATAGKQAILYELVSRDTSEVYVSRRRREHRAYRHHGRY